MMFILIFTFGLFLSNGLAIECNLNGLCEGHFLGSEITSEIYDCIQFCRQVQDCEWYSRNQDNEICIAFADCPYLDESKSDTISGQRYCSAYICRHQGSCKGIIIDIQTAKSEDYCLNLCQTEPKCRWYSFNSANNVCVLQEDCPEIDTSCLSCSFGQKECKSQASNLTILLSYNSYNEDSFEFIDIANDVVLDSHNSEYPDHIDNPAEMIFDEEIGKLRACGGRIPSVKQKSTSDESRSYTDKCFTFDGYSWEEMASLPNYIYPYSSSRFSVQAENEGWWIFHDDCSANCNDVKSYLLDKNQTWKEGPSFPDYGYSYTPYKFCGTHVNASHTVVTGGQINYDGSTISDVWFYNWEDNSWKAGPHMTIPRRLHDCIGISNNRVMVAGGVGLNEEALVSVEIFDPALRPGGGWYQVQDLPEDDYFYDTTLLFNSEIIWINSRHIWKFVDDVWLKLDSELSNDPSYRLTMLVPDNFVPSKLFENRAYL